VAGLSSCYLVAYPVQAGRNPRNKPNRYQGNAPGRYIRVRWNGRREYIHRLVRQLVDNKPIAKPLVASHLCELPNDKLSRRCANPNHIVIETMMKNLHRSPNTFRKSSKDLSAANPLPPTDTVIKERVH
jgi:hypothetical protein